MESFVFNIKGMARYLQLQVPSSCKENWNNMRPDQSGRHCYSCQKTVIDFTQMTDSELVNYFTTYQGSTCGRFTESQLNKNIPYPKKPLPWIKYFFQFSLPAFLLSLKSGAATAKLPVVTEIAPVKYQAAETNSISDTVPVSGFVSDDKGIPVPFASVTLKGTNRGVLTNAEGGFTFKHLDLPATLVVSSIGFVSSELHLSSPQQINIKLQLAPMHLGDVVVVGLVVRGKSKRKSKKESKPEKQMPTVQPANMLVYPNPVMAGSSLILQCRSFETGSYLAEFYSVSGQLVKASRLNYDKKSTQINLSIEEMISGTYFLHLTHENGKQYSRQVIIRN